MKDSSKTTSSRLPAFLFYSACMSVWFGGSAFSPTSCWRSWRRTSVRSSCGCSVCRWRSFPPPERCLSGPCRSSGRKGSPAADHRRMKENGRRSDQRHGSGEGGGLHLHHGAARHRRRPGPVRPPAQLDGVVHHHVPLEEDGRRHEGVTLCRKTKPNEFLTLWRNVTTRLEAETLNIWVTLRSGPESDRPVQGDYIVTLNLNWSLVLRENGKVNRKTGNSRTKISQ